MTSLSVNSYIEYWLCILMHANTITVTVATVMYCVH